MRKWYIILVLVVLSLSFFTISKASVEGIVLAEFPEDSVLFSSVKKTNSKVVVGQMIVLPEKSFDQQEAALIINRISALPLSMLRKINEEGIIVKLFEGKLTDNPTAKHLRGKIPRGYEGEATWDNVPGIGGSKTVLVKIGNSEKGMGHGSVNLELHEMAHSIDRYIYSEMKNNPHFLKVWENEKAKLFPGQSYFLLFPEEYFAESFAMYFLNIDTRSKLKTLAPETYAIISQLK